MVSKARLREEGEKAAGGEGVSGRAGVWWGQAASKWGLEMVFLGSRDTWKDMGRWEGGEPEWRAGAGSCRASQEALH